ncbi:MAG: hypothetical protein WKF77_29370 [Planctomycetaceae bacterium]
MIGNSRFSNTFEGSESSEWHESEVNPGDIGAPDCRVVAHSLTVYPDGRRLLVTSPIRIGARAVIGGDSQVHAGVRIGSDAIIEREAVAQALHRPVDSITPMLSALDTVEWDSLAQLVMAVELKDRFGITLSSLRWSLTVHGTTACGVPMR